MNSNPKSVRRINDDWWRHCYWSSCNICSMAMCRVGTWLLRMCLPCYSSVFDNNSMLIKNYFLFNGLHRKKDKYRNWCKGRHSHSPIHFKAWPFSFLCFFCPFCISKNRKVNKKGPIEKCTYINMMIADTNASYKSCTFRTTGLIDLSITSVEN